MTSKTKYHAVTVAQIITILGLIGGFVSNRVENRQNDDSIKGANSWMVEAIKERNKEIKDLQISDAILKQKIDDLQTYYLKIK